MQGEIERIAACPFCGAEPTTWKGGFRFDLSRTQWAGCQNGHNMISMPLGQWNRRNRLEARHD